MRLTLKRILLATVAVSMLVSKVYAMNSDDVDYTFHCQYDSGSNQVYGCVFVTDDFYGAGNGYGSGGVGGYGGIGTGFGSDADGLGLDSGPSGLRRGLDGPGIINRPVIRAPHHYYSLRYFALQVAARMRQQEQEYLAPQIRKQQEIARQKHQAKIEQLSISNFYHWKKLMGEDVSVPSVRDKKNIFTTPLQMLKDRVQITIIEPFSPISTQESKYLYSAIQNHLGYHTSIFGSNSAEKVEDRLLTLAGAIQHHVTVVNQYKSSTLDDRTASLLALSELSIRSGIDALAEGIDKPDFLNSFEEHLNEADVYSEMSHWFLDLIRIAVPAVSLGADAYEAIVGRDFQTQAELGIGGRSVAMVGIMLTIGTAGGSNIVKGGINLAARVIRKLSEKYLHESHFTLKRLVKSFGQAENAISSARRMVDSAGHVQGGAKNIFHYHSLKQTLKEAELSSIFEKSGVIKSEHIKDSIKIISGSNLKNPKLISELTKDGSRLQDWGKYTYNIKTSSGTYEVHYYFNEKLGTVNPNVDYKILLPSGGIK